LKKILLLGPLTSGHLQKWISPCYKDFEFVFFTLHDSILPDNFSASKVYRFPRITNTRLDFLLAIPYLQYVVFKCQPNIIYSSFLSSYGLLGASIFTRVSRILATWGTDVNGKPQSSWVLKLLINRLIKNYCWINAPAEHIKDKLIKLGAKADLISVFQYGIDISQYPIKTEALNQGLPVKFLSIRNWGKLYNIESILRGYSIFSNKYNVSSELTIIGKGTDSEERSLITLMESLDFNSSKVNFVGFVDRDSLNNLLLSNDVVISIPSMDGTPLSLLESMYVGLLPIVSNIDANIEWVHENCGVYTAYDDVYDVANSLFVATGLIKSNVISSIQEKNRNLVIKKADYSTNTKKLKRVFDNL